MKPGSVKRGQFEVSWQSRPVKRREDGGISPDWNAPLVRKTATVEVEVDLDGLTNLLLPKAQRAGGKKSVLAGGWVTCYANGRLDVDLKGLARLLGSSAARSKGGKSILGGGYIVVRKVKTPGPVHWYLAAITSRCLAGDAGTRFRNTATTTKPEAVTCSECIGMLAAKVKPQKGGE